MVQVKRITPQGDITLEIRASKLAWSNVVQLVWDASQPFCGETQELIDALHREIHGSK